MLIAGGVLSRAGSHRSALPSLIFQTSSAASAPPQQRQAKYSENKLKCTKARNDYLLNLAATNAVVAKYYIHDVSDMIDVSMSSPRHTCPGAFVTFSNVRPRHLFPRLVPS